LCPVTAAWLAEMARLREVIVIVIAKLRGGGVTPWTRQWLSRFWWLVCSPHGVLGFCWVSLTYFCWHSWSLSGLSFSCWRKMLSWIVLESRGFCFRC
jgi:hypothetical protein